MVYLNKESKKMFNLKKSQNQLDEQLNEAIGILDNLQIEIPVGAMPEQIIAMAEQMQQAAPKIQDAGNNIGQMGNMQEQIGQQMLQNRQQMAAKNAEHAKAEDMNKIMCTIVNLVKSMKGLENKRYE